MYGYLTESKLWSTTFAQPSGGNGQCLPLVKGPKAWICEKLHSEKGLCVTSREYSIKAV